MVYFYKWLSGWDKVNRTITALEEIASRYFQKKVTICRRNNFSYNEIGIISLAGDKTAQNRTF